MRPLIVVLVLLGGCTVRRAAPAPSNPDDEAVRLAVQQYYRDMTARDWPAYAAHFWPRATLTTVWKPPRESAPRVVVTTIDSFLATTGEGPDSRPIFEERLLGQDVRMAGNLAHVWARYEARFGDSALVRTWRGVDAFTWMKHDGAWRIVALAYTDEAGQTRGAP
jgi:hypothetical protein